MNIMKGKKFKVNNVMVYSFFAVVIILTVSVFGFFMWRFSKVDDKKYPINIGSVFYNDDYKYLKAETDSYLAQKLDGNYYWYQKQANKTVKEKVGPNPVVFNKSDYKVYLYGAAYQVMSSGEIKSLSGMTEISKTSPTKFYKLRDRKYLMVDSSLRTSDNSVKTSGYLIIELDKQGNATFANNELNVKTIKPLILKGTTMNFDIANEKLIYGKQEINVKNIIGSTNDYKEAKEEDEDKDKSKSSTNPVTGGGGANTVTDTTEYYDEYVRDVIFSVNNLTNSITEVNDKTDTSVKKGEIYYDFSKYIALKNVSSAVTSITLNYTVVDSNNEYQNVFIAVDDNTGSGSPIKYYLNKNETSYTIRNLMMDHNYTLSFGYRLASDGEDVVDDVVNIKTKAPKCDISVTKVGLNNITYKLKIGSDYKFDSGIMRLSVDETLISEGVVNMNEAASNSGYVGSLNFTRLGSVNLLKLENIVYNGDAIDIDCSYRFVS